MEGESRDMHGAHMITTFGFKNMHLSHIEIFNAGQPRLARYPVHWHHAGYVGATGGYADPSHSLKFQLQYLKPKCHTPNKYTFPKSNEFFCQK